jgi:hypothetical protein
MTTGKASLAKALVNGLTPSTSTPAGRSLVEAYKAWTEREENAIKERQRRDEVADLRADVNKLRATVLEFLERKGR